MVTRAEAKIHRVGPRHTIYLAKDLVEDSTFPFRVDEDLTVRIEGHALVIDKDGRSGRRTTKLDEADSLRDRLVTKTLDVLNFSPLTSKAERINHMLSEIHEAEMLESGVRHMPKNDHGILLWEEESSLDTVLSEFFDSRATGRAPKGLFSAKPSTFESVNNLPTRIAVEDYSWLLQNGFAKGLMELEQNIGRRVKENMTILCGYNIAKLTDAKKLETLLDFHGYAILDQPFRVYRRGGPVKPV